MTSALITREDEDTDAHREKLAIYKARNETSEEANPAGNQLLASRIVRE